MPCRGSWKEALSNRVYEQAVEVAMEMLFPFSLYSPVGEV